MLELLRQALFVTGLVLVMMLLVEYLHVATGGVWQRILIRRRWQQYLLASVLGATPGCMGAFAVVALYTHGRVTLGAVAASMLATAGDESFVMFAMFPRRALVIHAALFALGIGAAYLADGLMARSTHGAGSHCDEMVVHTGEEGASSCGRLAAEWKACTLARGVLAAALVSMLACIVSGAFGPSEWTWTRVSMVIAVGLAITVVAIVSDHFLKEHLWAHIVKRHIPRVFVWTLGALALVHGMSTLVDLGSLAGAGRWALLVAACLVGIIPESGPHLLFVTLYAKGLLPTGILIANSIVQDGHGALPLLAHSRRAFLIVKLTDLVLGLAVGALMLGLSR